MRRVSQGEDLEPAAVRDDRRVAADERVEASGVYDEVRAGLQHEVVRVAEHELQVGGLELLVRDRFQGAHGADCDEPRGVDDPVRGVNPPHARVRFLRLMDQLVPEEVARRVRRELRRRRRRRQRVDLRHLRLPRPRPLLLRRRRARGRGRARGVVLVHRRRRVSSRRRARHPVVDQLDERARGLDQRPRSLRRLPAAFRGGAHPDDARCTRPPCSVRRRNEIPRAEAGGWKT